MITLNRILCPVDFSKPSRRALQYALAIARWHESDVTVLHVEDALLRAASVEAGVFPDLNAGQYHELQEFINDAGGKGRNVDVHIATGTAVSGILESATRQASDLIVMGTNGRSGLARAVLGSVTERVVRQSAVPVLTIPASAEMSDSHELMPFDPILCASDFSPASRKALELGILMGQEADARLILLHAIHVPQVDAGIASLPFPFSTAMDISELRRDASVRLKRGLPADAVFRCRPETVVVEGPPADSILETATREDVKLIVMGVQSRGAIDRFLFGSTTRRVMQAAICPVLSIRASEAAEPWTASSSPSAEAVAVATIEG